MSPDVVAFLQAKAAAGLSPLTLQWYGMFVSAFMTWAELRDLPIKKPETVEGFLLSLRQEKKSPVTVSDCYTALTVFFNWMVRRKRLRVSPMTMVQRPRLPKTRKPHITRLQFERLYHSISGESWTDYRDRAILLVLFYSGLRANELLSLSHESINRDAGVLHVDRGKGERDRNVPYLPAALDMLEIYLCLCPGYNPEHLFLAGGGTHNSVRGPLTFSGLRQMVRRRCQAAGLKRFGLHIFRHGFAMVFLNEGGMELATISRALGHSSIDLTRRFYADFETTTLCRRYDEAIKRMDHTV